MLINQRLHNHGQDSLIFNVGLWSTCVTIFLLSFNKIILTDLSNYIVPLVMVVLDINALLLTNTLIKKATQPQARMIYLLFAVVWLAVMINDGLDLYVDYFGNTLLSNLPDNWFSFTFTLFLLSHVVVWALIFLHFSDSNEKRINVNSLPLIFTATIIFVIFVFGFSWKINYFSAKGLYNIVQTFLDMAGFVLATLCLARARTSGIKYIAVGYLLNIALDVITGNQSVQGTHGLYDYLDTGMIFGQILLNYGLFVHRENVNHEDQCLASTNSMQNQLALWGFSLAMLSVFMFLGFDLIFSPNNQEAIDNLPLILILISTAVIFASVQFSQKIISPIYTIVTAINNFLTSKQTLKTTANQISEFQNLQQFIHQSFQLQETQGKTAQEFADYAKRVIHDIRTPLSAINTVVHDIPGELQDNQRHLLQHAVKHLNNIINMTLTSLRTKSQQSDKDAIVMPVLALLHDLVLEKQTQYCHQDVRIEIIANDTNSTYLKIEPVAFERAVGNLIDNAVEATMMTTKPDKHVWIELKCDPQAKACIIIKDNGCGMSTNDIAAAIQGRLSKKPAGNGLGLSTAIKIAQSWGGTLNVESALEEGTCIALTLPPANVPSLFAEQISLPAQSTIVILDDDFEIHQRWDARLSTFNLSQYHIQVEHFYHADEFIDYIHQHRDAIGHCLVDHILHRSSTTGLELIASLDIAHQSVLVTNNYDQENIIEQAKQMNLHILPKPILPYIDILITSDQIDLILLDDSESVTLAWEYKAQKANKTIAAFNDVDTFTSYVLNCDSSVPIYIDANLKNDIKGEQIAKELYDHGYQNLYITTGHSPEMYAHVSWVKKVIGKEPPFN